MINKRILGLIGLANKARQIAFGADSVELDIKKKQVYLIIVAKEASQRTKDKFINLSRKFNIPIIIDGNIEELSQAIGKTNKAIIGIKNINLSAEIQKINNGGDTIG